MILKAIKSDKTMLKFVLVEGDKSFEKVKESCLEYENNQNVHVPDETNGSREKTGKTRHGDRDGKPTQANGRSQDIDKKAEGHS